MFLQMINFFKWFAICLTVVGLLVSNLFSREPVVEGAEYLQLGRSVESLSLGGTSLGLMPSAGVMLDHPAGGARLIRKNFLLQSGLHMSDLSADMNGPQSFEYVPGLISYTHPSPYGVFNAAVSSYFPLSSSVDLGYLSTVSAAFAKNISNFVDFGLRLNFDYVFPRLNTGSRAPIVFPNDDYFATSIFSSWGINLDWSLVLHFSADFVNGPWSFRDFRMGFSSRSLGWPAMLNYANDSRAFVKIMDLFRVGIGFDFITATNKSNDKIFTSRLALEGAVYYPLTGGFFAGLKNTLFIGPEKQHNFFINLGSFFSPISFDIFPLTSGLGFLLHLEKVDLVFEQSLMLEQDIRTIAAGDFSIEGFAVGFNFQVKFGKVDKDKPVIDTSYWGEENADGSKEKK